MGSVCSSPDLISLVAQALTGEAPISDLVSTVAASVHADHFALLRFHDHSCAVISGSSQDLDCSTLPNGRFNLSTKTLVLGEDRGMFGLDNIGFVISVEIDKVTRLVFFAGDSIDISEQLRETLSGIGKRILEKSPYDIPFLLARIARTPEDTLAQLGLRGFSVDALNEDDTMFAVVAMFSDFLDDLKVDKVEFVKFVVDIRSMYNNVPYHNWRHAADTTQFVYSLIKNAKVDLHLSKIERFAVLFSAVCHDTDHDGLNNNFQRKAKTILAQLAPNMPPLELHHADVTINTLNLRHSRVLANWTDSDILYFEKYVVSCILATDMEQHKGIIEEFAKTRPVFDKDNEEHRMLLGRIIMKAADLSNTVRDFAEATVMTEKLLDEYFLQGDRETRMGLEVSPMCDRNKAGPVPAGQIGFYKFVAGPLMAELHAFFPELDENEKQYNSNLAKWTEMRDSLSE